MMSSDSFEIEVPTSDRDTEVALQQRQHDAATQILDAFGGFLDHADATIDGLEGPGNSDILPSAILRRCGEIADAVGHMAGALEDQTPEEQRQLAQACLQDVQQLDEGLAQARNQPNDLTLTIESESLSTADTEIMQKPEVTEDDFLKAIQGASYFLRDVEESLREISHDDAEDISDAALTLARLFIISLQSLQSTLTPEDLVSAARLPTTANRSAPRSTVTIEVVDEEGEVLEEDPANETQQKKRRHKQPQKLRVLWPRLGPEVAKALNWSKGEAAQQPVLAVALGFMLWPAAVCTTIVGGSMVLADQCIQDVYEHFQEGPIISNVEQGAAQVYQAGKLYFLVTLLMGKQTLRVAKRQIDRQGGIEKVAENAVGMAVDRITHPIETMGMVWDGVAWTVGTAAETALQIYHQLRPEEQVAQELQ